jgi:16S rRNA (guanine527-N7)-methyltransferase
MDAARERLERLTERWSLPARTAESLWLLVERIAADPHAPTAVRDPARAVDLHVADSLSLLDLGLPRPGTEVVDIGAGAGFPGLALAAAVPECRFDLLEASARKAEWIRGAAAAVGLENAGAHHARAEQWARAPENRERYGLALARALASSPVLLEYASPLLAVGGRLVAWKGRRDPEEEARAVRAGDQLGMAPAEARRVDPFEDARDHHLHVWEKRSRCPARFPRRPGVARKRPLGEARSGRPESAPTGEDGS